MIYKIHSAREHFIPQMTSCHHLKLHIAQLVWASRVPTSFPGLSTEFAKIARIIASPYFNISLVRKNLQSFNCLMFSDSRFFFHFSATVASLISLNCYSICLLEHFPAQKLHVSSSRKTENNGSLVVPVMLMGWSLKWSNENQNQSWRELENHHAHS